MSIIKKIRIKFFVTKLVGLILISLTMFCVEKSHAVTQANKALNAIYNNGDRLSAYSSCSWKLLNLM